MIQSLKPVAECGLAWWTSGVPMEETSEGGDDTAIAHPVSAASPHDAHLAASCF